MEHKFPQKVRLTKNFQFNEVFGKKRKTVTELFTVYFCENNFSYSRLGIIVPKKNIRNSTQRNYYKRIIREEFRLNQHQLKDFDFLVFVKRNAVSLTRDEVRDRLKQKLKEFYG